MKNLFKRSANLFLVVAILITSVLPASGAAEDARIGLSPSGNLFAKMEEMMPGDSITEYIVITNKTGESGGFFLTPEDMSSVDFDSQLEMDESEKLLDQLNLKLVKYSVDEKGIVADSGVEIYNGKADGSSPHPSKQYVDHWKGSMFLGEVGSRGNLVIGATLHASERIDNDFEHIQAKFKWTFNFQKWVIPLYEEGTDKPDIPPHLWGKNGEEKEIPLEEILEHESIIVLSGKPSVLPLPQTGGGERGNTGSFVLLGVLLLALLITLVLLINRPRKRERT